MIYSSAECYRGKGYAAMQQTTKPIFTNRQLITLLWPLIIEQALSVLVGMADTMMVSSAGEAAISGVSLVDMINQLIITIFAALATGGAVHNYSPFLQHILCHKPQCYNE